MSIGGMRVLVAVHGSRFTGHGFRVSRMLAGLSDYTHYTRHNRLEYISKLGFIILEDISKIVFKSIGRYFCHFQ